MGNAILPKWLFGKLMRVIGHVQIIQAKFFAVPFPQENIFGPTCHFITCKCFFLSPQKKKKKIALSEISLEGGFDQIHHQLLGYSKMDLTSNKSLPNVRNIFYHKKATDFPPSPFFV